MDFSSVSALPVAISGRSDAGVSGTVQAMLPAVVSGSASGESVPPDRLSAGIDTSGSSRQNTAAPATQSRDVPSRDSLAQAVKQVNDSFKQRGQNLYASFEKDKITGIDIVKIVDQKTNETISQMPPKEMVALAQFLEHPQGMRGKLIYATA